MIPDQPTTEDIDIAAVRALVCQGVVGPHHRRWNDLRNVAYALGIRPEDAVYRVRDGIWSDRSTDPLTLADHIRAAAQEGVA